VVQGGIELKKVFLFLILLLTFTGCSSESGYINSYKEVNSIFTSLIAALENKDKQTIKELFAIEVQQNAESLDEQIEDLITYFDGDVISYDTAKVYGEGKVVNDGVITYYRVGNARSENVVTTKETYKISFSEILVDADKKSNEGIWRIWIGKSEEDYMIIGISDMPR
jgi:hypothetical protein